MNKKVQQMETKRMKKIYKKLFYLINLNNLEKKYSF